MVNLPLTTENYALTVRKNGKGFKLTHVKTVTVQYLTEEAGRRILNRVSNDESFDNVASDSMACIFQGVTDSENAIYESDLEYA